MKKYITFLLLLLMLSIFGCVKNHDLANINSENVSYIEFQTGPIIKKVIKSEDINSIISIINSIQYKNIPEQDDLNGWRYKVTLFLKDESLTTISFLDNKIQYNTTWYNVNDNVLNSIEELYNSLY